MFKREEKGQTLPMMGRMRAMAETQTRIWGLAKMGLVVWVLFMAIGLIMRIVSTVRAFRTNREELPGDVDMATARPTYALLNFNVYSGGKKKAE